MPPKDSDPNAHPRLRRIFSNSIREYLYLTRDVKISYCGMKHILPVNELSTRFHFMYKHKTLEQGTVYLAIKLLQQRGFEGAGNGNH